MKISKKLSPITFSITTSLLLLQPLTAQEVTNPTSEADAGLKVDVDQQQIKRSSGAVTSFASVIEKVAPSVVTIFSTKSVKRDPRLDSLLNNPQLRRFFGIPDDNDHRGGKVQGLGSGIIVSKEGHILTNNHVIDGADEVMVRVGMEKHEYRAEKIGTDPATDLAVLKIEADNEISPIVFADSSKVKAGDLALAIGNPFGLTQSVSMGIVSAVGRGGMGLADYGNFIQTDAAINPGNSGGALVNTRGQLVGINTAIFSQSGGYQGVGFAVPTNLAKPVYDSLVSTGKVVRGFLGVGIQAVTTDLADSFKLDQSKGALVTNVVPGSPADQAGLKRGDVIVEYQGKPVLDPRSLQHHVIRTTIGTEVKMVVIRDGQKQTLKAEIREQDKAVQVAQAGPMGTTEGPLAGVAVQNLNPGMAEQLGVEENVNGVVVMDVAPGSYAARAGLAQGDVISEINRNPVRSEEDFRKVTSNLKDTSSALIFIHRGQGALYLTVKV